MADDKENINKEETKKPDDDVFQSVEEVPKPTFFKSSDIEQPPALRQYLDEQLSNPFNNFCIDCKKKKTTHAIVWLGAYVCGDCAEMHKNLSGGNSNVMIKDVFNEHWDDY